MKRALLATMAAAALARCATMVNTPSQKIPVKSEPPGAVVSVDCGNAPLYGGVTPTVITVQRAAEPCGITVAMPGYASQTIVFKRAISGATRANKVPGVVLGAFTGLVGIFITSDGGWIDPEAAGSIGYDLGEAAGSAPGNAIDRKTGAAFKHVPGEVFVRLEPEVTESAAQQQP
ncbi:MAG TPA: hypothetical protein VF824_07555 [Thermoanaerobaculia bacterium]|jgi:hypothetical protein